MSKNEYLAELKSRLMSLPSDERDAAIKYYLEFFEDAGEDKEQEVIAELGSPKALADSIINEQNRTEKSSTEFIPANICDVNNKNSSKTSNINQQKNNNTILIILILILCSPIIVPIAATIFGLFVGLLATIFGIWVAFGAIILGFSVGGIALFATGLCALFVRPLEGLAAIGIGLILLAVGLLLLIPFILICTKLMPAIVRAFVNLFSRIFHRNQVLA